MIISLMLVFALVLAYTWLIYPAAMLLVARKAQDKNSDSGMETSGVWPRVTILLSAHNEERVIGQRLDNLAALDYPADRVTVLVGVDGASDRTADIARAWAASRSKAHVVVSPVNRGKMAMIRDLVAIVQRSEQEVTIPCDQPSTINHQPFQPPSSLLVFTDANTLFDRDALKRLVEPFGDLRIGGTCGRLVFHSASETQTDEPHYWDIETSLKTAESRLDSCLGANGAIYAIRRELFPPAIPDNVIVDDFVIGMKVREQGARMVFVPGARAQEDLPPTVAEEWTRRVRIGAGAYQALCLCRSCLAPRFGVFAWMFWSHKVLRWFTPHLLAAFSCVAGVRVWEWLMVDDSGAKVGVVGAGVCGLGLMCLLALRAEAKWSQPFRLSAYFFVIQTALFVGFLRFCGGDLSGAWKRTTRHVSSD